MEQVDDSGQKSCQLAHLRGRTPVFITTYQLGYRFWIVVGSKDSIVKRLDELWEKYSEESFELTNP